MKTITKLLAGAAVALSMSAASAQAAVFIGLSTDGGATITQVFSGGDATFEYLTTNLGGFDTISVEGDPSILPALLHSDVVNVNASGAASVSIFVTRTGISAPTYGGFFSSFSSNNSNNRFTVVTSTYVDDDDDVFGLDTLLASSTFSASGSQSSNFISPGAVPDGVFSVTNRYDISTTGGGTTSPTIILGAVPEPGTWALMIMGFGGAGAMIRSRRRQMAAA
ncbi:MAG: PEPxxWA-CTERM sorting domain-containing protein [Phenylobacterium sp.]|uniref:PEPxxWA-CTERM sorting domain-containing protein n=1 Tax=Phenylobacterium sp. TaxID=1871053 RepID=UPI001A39CF4B|nr:PEPxxWA-CTERM sorting domain-containing protein [Phenylobacterium sp.]MBL8770964.1 PEPxxWA-CTERM sorting domain-containing protein [Phenylobacterium sp.]